MKRVFGVLAVLLLCVIPTKAEDKPVDQGLASKVMRSVGLLYSQTEEGSMRMRCTTTAYAKEHNGYMFVSAAHCVGDDDVQHERSADATKTSFYITFDEKKVKKFYLAKPLLVGYQHRGEDFSVFHVDTNEEWTTIPLGDEQKAKEGTSIINVASPLGLGKQMFRGTISSLDLDRPIIENDINWQHSMLLSIQAGPGSSGSALVAEDQEAIVGFLVGTIGGNNIVGIPVSRFKNVLKMQKDSKYHWYQVEEE